MMTQQNKHDLNRFMGALYRESLSAFTQKVFQVVSGGDTYLHNWHIDYISEKLEACYSGDIKRLIINIPPRYMKSICASIAFPVWVLGKAPYKKIIVASYAQELSLKHSIDCKAVMESPFYKEVFPNVQFSRHRNTQSEYMTTYAGFRMSTSVSGTLTGRGGDILIIDDPIKPGDALSDTTRQSVNQWYDNTLYSRLNDKQNGCIIIIMQRLHEDDLVGHVLEQEDWVHIKIPAIAEERQKIVVQPNFVKPYTVVRETGDVLHPARETAAQLKHLRTSVLGSYNFAGQYQQEPAPLEGGLIKLKWLKTYKNLPDEAPKRIVQSWDTASKAGELNDFSVCTTWHEYRNGYYLVHVLRKKLEFPELKKIAHAHAESFDAKAVLIEDKGSGTQLIQELKKETRLSVIGIEPEFDKITRMVGQTPKMEAGKVFVPEENNADWMPDLTHELSRFPNAKHDDQVDSISQALAWMSRSVKTVRIS